MARTSARMTSDVRLPPQDPANGRRDVAWRERGHRHLVEQRLEDVMVAAVDDRESNLRAPQRARRVEPAKAAADDHDMGKRHEGRAWYYASGPGRDRGEGGRRREGGGRRQRVQHEETKTNGDERRRRQSLSRSHRGEAARAARSAAGWVGRTADRKPQAIIAGACDPPSVPPIHAGLRPRRASSRSHCLKTAG